MQDENRENRTEPQEVVSWYVRPEGQEVVDCYVQPRPLPSGAAPQTPREPEKRSRKGLWSFLIAAGVLVLAVVAATVVASLRGGGAVPPVDGGTGDGGDASSIVNISGAEKTTIPRIQGEAGVSLVCTAPAGEKLSIQDMYEKVNPSTVLVVADKGEQASIGTGVIMTADGYIITNAHVISGGKDCWIALDTGYTYDAKLVGYSEERDLAVLKAVDAADLPAASFGDSDLCRVGDTVYAIGNPLGVELRGTLTDGIISAINRDVQVDGRVMTLLQTTAALNNGNSGGPLINEYGQVVGINTLKMSGNGSEMEATVEGLGFAVPISDACFVVNDIIANGRFRGVPVLGVMVIESTDNGGQVSVYTVSEGGGAEEAGLLPGDVLLRADGQTLHSIHDLMAVRRTHLVGDTMTLTVLRDGQTFDADVPLYASED
jgi:serine protease Do